jgi:RNA polymerase-binding transcription factor DksA
MEELKKQLEAEHDNLIAELKTIAVKDSRTGDWIAQPDKLTGEADPNMTADTTEGWNERRALLAQLETRYHNVLLALKKFEENTFGKCEICQEEVETARLDANPAARTCKMHMERERELPL